MTPPDARMSDTRLDPGASRMELLEKTMAKSDGPMCAPGSETSNVRSSFAAGPGVATISNSRSTLFGGMRFRCVENGAVQQAENCADRDRDTDPMQHRKSGKREDAEPNHRA